MVRTFVLLSVLGCLTAGCVAKPPLYVVLPQATPAVPAPPSSAAQSQATPAAPTHLSPMLNNTERICAAFGGFAFNRAVERDRGVSLTLALAQSRQWDTDHALALDVRTIHDEVILAIYAVPGSTPSQIQQAFEVGCLTPKPPAAASTIPPQTGQWR